MDGMGTKTVVVRIDESGPVHISEVISQVLPRYLQRQLPSTRNPLSRNSGQEHRTNGLESGRLVRYPLGAFWIPPYSCS